MRKLDKYRGSLIGLAIGDALGTTLEFTKPGSFEPIAAICGGGPFTLSPGQWTDDTAMAICLSESLIACRGFDPADQLRRYLRWYELGENSSTGVCFAIGKTTRQALLEFRRTGQPYPGPADEYSAGNGSLMRLAPVALFYADNIAAAIEYAAQSSRTTHGAKVAIDACRLFAALLINAITGLSKAEILSPDAVPATLWQNNDLAPVIAAIAAGSYKRKQPPAIQGSGYAAASLEAALWAFYHSTNFADGALLAVNLGDDADTTGAIYGQLAGAYYGEQAIPAEWRAVVFARRRLENLADQLYTVSKQCHTALESRN